MTEDRLDRLHAICLRALNDERRLVAKSSGREQYAAKVRWGVYARILDYIESEPHTPEAQAAARSLRVSIPCEARLPEPDKSERDAEIRERYMRGDITQKELARRRGLSQAHVSGILNGLPAQLREAKAAKMREMYAKNGSSLRGFSRATGIPRSTLRRMLRGEA